MAEQIRGPSRRGRTPLALVVLGMMLLAPFFWMQRETITTATVTATTNTASNFAQMMTTPASPPPAMGENEQRSLLDTPRPVALAEPLRACRSGNHRELPKLVTVQQWFSTKSRPRESISMLTQLSADRLTMLENQCRTWPDPIIAVIFVPLIQNHADPEGKPTVASYDNNTSMKDVIKGIAGFHQFMETTAQCALRIELVGQYIKLENPLSAEYPINALRNKALSLAQTELVLVLDVDFVASPMLALPEPGYRDPAVYNQMVELADRRKAIVLPAFEITNRRQDLTLAQNFARNLVVAGKEEMRAAWKAGEVDAFNGQDAPWGHGPTNTSKWIRLSRPILYRAKYEAKYEPFVIMSRRFAPWADERFVGYGGNKIAYINQLHGLGFGFHVHPYGFAIHVPHVRTRAANVFVAQKQRGESAMDELRLEVEDSIARRKYQPVVAACKERPEEELEGGNLHNSNNSGSTDDESLDKRKSTAA